MTPLLKALARARKPIEVASALLSFSAFLAFPILARAADVLPAGAKSWRVLIVFSEGKDLPGNISLEQAVKTALLKKAGRPVEFYTEHMDASRFSDEAHYRLFRDYLGAKYAGQEPDVLIIVSARDFTLPQRLPAEVFHNVPLVFVTSSELDPPETLKKNDVAGVIVHLDTRGTMLLARGLQPELQKFVVIGGKSESDRRLLARIQADSALLPEMEFEYWTNQPFKEIQARATTLPPRSAILVSTIFEDGAGQTIYMTYAAQMLTAAADIPIYTFASGAIGSGAIGGAVVDPRRLGERAATLAMEMLERKSSGKLEENSNSTVMLDWKALRKWNISSMRWPGGAVIANRPRSLWEEHKGLISSAVGVILAQALTIAALLAQRTRRRRAEAEILKQRDELAHVTRVSTLGQLASSLAHEINQPLGAILRNTEAAELFLQKDQPDLAELKAILADIRKDDQRAGGVIDRMRSLLKRQNLQSRPVDVDELLNETVAIAQPDAQARQIKLSLEVRPGLPEIRGDRVNLQQVLLNLILNAMDAMKDEANGERVVSIRAAETTDGGVEISVSDSGEGIAPDKIGHVFEPFFTTKPAGLGMGLAISKTIVEAHGGKIRAQNNSTRGATFHFTLPGHPS